MLRLHLGTRAAKVRYTTESECPRRPRREPGADRTRPGHERWRATITGQLYLWWAMNDENLRRVTFPKIDKLFPKNLRIGSRNGSPLHAIIGVLSLMTLGLPSVRWCDCRVRNATGDSWSGDSLAMIVEQGCVIDHCFPLG